MQTFLLSGSQQVGVDTHGLPTQKPKKMNYCSLSVASLALLWFGAAHAQTENTSTWPAHNRYIALNLGQQQRQYRELEIQGLTTSGTLNADARHQRLAARPRCPAPNWCHELHRLTASKQLQPETLRRLHMQRCHTGQRQHRLRPKRRCLGRAFCSYSLPDNF